MEEPAQTRTISDEESRAAMRTFLQRCEVRLSTIHRVAQALLGGSALVLLLPLFIRDGFPKMATLLISSYDANQHWLVIGGIAVAAALSVILPVVAVYLLVGDLLGFYFTSNTFGAPERGHAYDTHAHGRPIFNPRFIIPGLGFNNDEVSEHTKAQIDEGRKDAWTRALLVPKSLEDAGWRDRFDTRTFEIWGHTAAEGLAGDEDRLRQSFRLAGLTRDRTLAQDVARTEALLARHVLHIRIAVLRYSKALMLMIVTMMAILAAAGIVEHALHTDPSGGRFVGGVPYRYLFLVALVYVVWAPVAARSVTLPLRMIHRRTPGMGKHEDAYLDKLLTQFESATVLVTLVGLLGAGAALIVSGYMAGGTTGLTIGIVLGVAGILLWVAALTGYSAPPRQTLSALMLLVRGREAPCPSQEMREKRSSAT
ncbi:hypothetical protein SAMN05660284_01281 [Formivibrio citricus]|uniref:Uncharacterized protein n=1 Tax=Formivibrio citricus TaxID=83765 RepID=A0A1I4Y9V3_9NEIS|nr:hypothetical protein [Formivibrio citricus]SFN34851.1 hypothetical protein SAMN05660284_01281 [Formivibrio citricus]